MSVNTIRITDKVDTYGIASEWFLPRDNNIYCEETVKPLAACLASSVFFQNIRLSEVHIVITHKTVLFRVPRTSHPKYSLTDSYHMSRGQ
jgi:hypothetical protein